MLTPDSDTGSFRMLGILRALREMSCDVTFCAAFPSSWPPYEIRLAEDTARLEKNGIRVASPRRYRSVMDFLEKGDDEFDFVLLSDIYTASRYLEKARARFPRAGLIFDTVDLHYLRVYREAKLYGSKPALTRALSIKRKELAAVRAADLTLTVSSEEKAVLLKECPKSRIHVLSGIYEAVPVSNPYRDRRDILFVGSFEHAPNIDAVEYFAGEIFPRILSRRPDIRLFVVGSHPPRRILDLASKNIIITGYVSDLEALFQACRISVAPLRFGAGIKGKILTSLSYGVPVLTTPLGAEGMDLQAGTEILIAHDPEDFARRLILLYGDEKQWNRMSRRGLEIIKKRFSSTVVRAGMENCLNEMERNRRNE